MTSWFWIILSRWVHLLSACLLIGATFFFAVVFVQRTAAEGEPASGALPNRARRSLKMLARTAIVLLIVTGIYNLLLNRIAYEHTLPLSHVLLGIHAIFWLLIAATIEIGLSRRTLAGRRALLVATVVLMFLTVAIASSLKYVREHPKTIANAPVTR